MDIKPIRNDDDLRAAEAEIEALMDAEEGTPEAERLGILAALVELYEDEHHPMPAGDPVEAILFKMDQMGWTRKDLEKPLGGRAMVSLVLNRRRPLSITMIRALAKVGIPVRSLIQESEVVAKKKRARTAGRKRAPPPRPARRRARKN